MELTPIVKELYQATKRIRESGKEVYRLGVHKSETERLYRMELAKRMMVLRIEKFPATLIGDIARGDVAELKFQRDLAAEKYRSALAAMDALKVEINALQTIAKYQSDL